MNQSTRHVDDTRAKAHEFLDESFGLLSLIAMSSIQALFLIVFITINQRVHDILDRSPSCLMKKAVMIMTLLFLLLDVLLVLAFCFRRGRAIFRSLKEDRRPMLMVATTHGTSVTVTITIAGALRGMPVLSTLPMAGQPDPSRFAKLHV